MGRRDVVFGFQTKGTTAELLILLCTNFQRAVEKHHLLRRSAVFRKGTGDILPRYAHILFALVPDGEVGSVLNFGGRAAGKVRFTKDIAQEHHALHLLLGVVQVYGRSAAGQSPCGGQHQSPVPYADVVTTTTHKTLRGPRGGLILTNNPIIAKRINSAVFPGTQGGPLEHVIAAKAVCFGEALKPEFKEYARKIVENAQALAAALQQRGVKLVSGGTDNHLMLIDLRDEECTGKDLEQSLDSVHITANKNTVPGETRSPFVTSGVRLGTPAVTTRGMGAAEMQVIADCIADCIWHYEEKKDEISARVLRLTREFPLYQ